DVAVLTLIASAHSQGLGDIDAIAREKAAIFGDLEGIAVGNYDDARVRMALARCRHPIGYGGDAAADYHFYHRRVLDERRTTLRIVGPRGEVATQIGLMGRAGAYACAAAIAVVESMLEMSVSEKNVERSMTGSEGRLLPRRAPSGLLVLDDSYNANPASCASSIDAAREIAAALGRRLILVLGEMRELGDESAEAHRELGRVAAASGAARLIAVGGDARLAVQTADMDARFVETSEQAAHAALSIVEPSDVVLVKGSRGVRTEIVVDALLHAQGAAP
ncbi:MAG TPA: cyanophycin synthetase, partial [Polyangiaceae bacterium]|nr:cyanophycin synthetase [Polyangiaceae bacterium]